MSEDVQSNAAEVALSDPAASPVSEKPAPKKRAPRAKKATGETSPDQVDSSLSEQADPAQKKPARRSARSRKSADAPSVSALDQGSSVVEAEEKPARTRTPRKEETSEEAPKPRRTRKSSSVEPVEGANAATDAAKADEAPSSAEGSAKEAPKPRRTRKRAAAPDQVHADSSEPSAQAAEERAADASAAPEGAAAAAEEKPRRGRPRRVSRDAAEQPASEGDDHAAGGEKPEGEIVSRPSADQGAEVKAGASEMAADSADGSSEEERAAQRKQRKEERASRASERGSKADRSSRDRKQNDRRQGDRNDRNDRAGRGGRDERGGRDDHRRQRRQHENKAPREVAPSVTLEELAEMKVADLRARAAELSFDATGLKKADLVAAVYAATLKAEGFVEVTGVLDVLSDGYGFLRTSGYLPGESDVYVGTSLIRRNGLRKGDFVVGQTRPARENEKFAAIQKIISVNGMTVDELKTRPRFGDLTPVYPDECLTMEHGKNTLTARVIDLTAPIGKGQRGLIVSPPKAGKTTVLKDIAASISANNPEVHLMCLLVDERPEEVTDMQRSIKGEVISSTFDMPTENHITVAELVIERAKRLVELGRDVVVLLDSLTRLARAYNLAQPASGRILSGGVDSTALYPPKKFLGAARNIEGGGSLTILASALVETGSKMDEVIFEEFKGTGNMELKLDRGLADRRIFPAIDPVASGTRKEELLLDPQEAPLIWAVRRILSNMNNTERAMDMLIKSLKQTDTNQEFLIRTAKKAQTQHGKSDEGFGF